MSLIFRVLGPLEVVSDGGSVPISAPKQRVILASLLLEPGRVVSVDRLVDHLWGENPGRTARQTLQVYVTRLRDALGDDAVISTAHDGYRIDAGPGTLDLADFQSLTERAAESGDRDAVAALLHEALGLWRGQVLSNVPSDSLHRDAVPGLVERHLHATERRIELDIGLGHAEDVITELQQLTAEHWLRERLWVLLMRALYYAGRQAEALETYRRVATLLADELGIDPSAELRELHQAILTGQLTTHQADVPARPAATSGMPPPRQLPARPAGFVGRKPMLDRLLSLFADEETRPIVVVTGAPGVGKSALATCAGHLLKDEFPDGQLVVDLHGFSASAAPRVTDVLARFLRALGMPPGQIPVDPEEQAAAYRSLLAGKAVLVVLDNAATAEQVRPLLPGEPRCGVVITSRNQLRGLVALDGARLLPLDVLPADEALEVLGSQVGADRLAAEPEAAAELAKLCSYLPLALRITGANLAISSYDKLSDYATELGLGDRLTSMWTPDDERTKITATFGLSYAALDEDAQALFRLLGAIPGPDFTRSAVAALAGDPAVAAKLDSLVTANMVQPHAPGRYLMHDLTRSYAQRRGSDREGSAAALRRLFGWYLEMTDAALVPRFPSRVRLARPMPSEEAMAKASVGWVDDELPNLLAAITHAAEHGPPEFAWHLTDALRAYFQTTTSYAEWDAAVRLALRAAEHERAEEARASLHLSLGVLAYLRQLDEEATAETTRAVELYERLGDRVQVAGAWHNMAMAHHGAKRWDEAIDSLTRALSIFRDEDHPHAAIASANLALCKHDMGRVAEAAKDLVEALRLSRHFGDRETEGRTLHWLGGADRTLGNLSEAVRYLDEAVAVLAELGDAVTLIQARTLLIRTHTDAGAYDDARREAETAGALGKTLTDHRLSLDVEVARAQIDICSGDAELWRDRLPEVLTELEQTHDEIRIGECLVSLAWMYRELGDGERALHVVHRALDHAGRQVLRLNENAAFTVCTAVLLQVGDIAGAVDRGEETVRRHRETSARLCEARALCYLGDAYLARGDEAEARHCWERGRDLYAAVGIAEIAEATRRLSA